MSGLLDMFVRRRRASAATRLGPHSQNGAHRDGASELTRVQGPDPVVDEPPVAAEPAGLPDVDEPAPAPVEEEPLSPIEDRASPPPPEPPPPEPPRAMRPAFDPPPAPPGTPVPRNRTQMRRRARYLRQLRELQLRDIGGFLVECYRFSRARPDLVETKMQEALQTDRELRALERALGDERPHNEVREPGIAGSCPECGSVHGSGDRFCAWCGHRL